MRDPQDYWLEQREKEIDRFVLQRAFDDALDGMLKLIDALNGFDDVDFPCEPIMEAKILIQEFLDKNSEEE